MGPSLLMKQTIPKERRPRYDYFEDAEIVKIQDLALLGMKRHWSSYKASFSLPPSEHPARVKFRKELTRLLAIRFKKNSLWLVKDPRSSVLVEDWLNILAKLELDTRLLIVHRDPRSNIRSFSSKGQVPEIWAEALWQRTYINALNAAEQLPSEKVAITCFEDLLSKPFSELERLCQTLDWYVNRKALKNIEKRVNLDLLTQEKQTKSKVVDMQQTILHDTTTELAKQLRGELSRTQHKSLADELQLASKDCSKGLQLNNMRLDEQTLAPKVSITIVTAELQGWGRSGGIGSAYRELASTLKTAGHFVRVLIIQPGPTKEGTIQEQFEVIQLDGRGQTRLSLIRHIAEYLKQNKTDIIHLHDWLGFASGLKKALEPYRPQLVVGIHGPSAWARTANPWPRSQDGGLLASEAQLFDEGLVQQLELDGLNQADWLISPSVALKNWVETNLSVSNINIPILVNRNCPLQQRLNSQPSELETTNTVDCAYFGRLEQRKGILIFVEALLIMPKPPTCVLFMGSDSVIGLNDDGSEQWGSELIKEKLSNKNICIIFEMNLSRDQALIRLMELKPVVVIPSLIENSPCVVDELLNSGLKMVVTNVGGTPELIPEKEQQWLSPAEPVELAKHLEQALKSIIDETKAYQLSPAIETWKIQLSWQAFHERLPSMSIKSTERLDTNTNEIQYNKDPWPLWRRVLRKTKVLATQGKQSLFKSFNIFQDNDFKN